jgi:hypothetical protein
MAAMVQGAYSGPAGETVFVVIVDTPQAIFEDAVVEDIDDNALDLTVEGVGLPGRARITG